MKYTDKNVDMLHSCCSITKDRMLWWVEDRQQWASFSNNFKKLVFKPLHSFQEDFISNQYFVIWCFFQPGLIAEFLTGKNKIYAHSIALKPLSSYIKLAVAFSSIAERVLVLESWVFYHLSPIGDDIEPVDAKKQQHSPSFPPSQNAWARLSDYGVRLSCTEPIVHGKTGEMKL